MMSLVLSREYLTFQGKKFKGKKINSKLGLPQRSVIAAILFILFIADWNMRVTSEKIKFTDDGTIWITGKDWHELVERFKENFKEILAWAKNGDFNF